MKIGAPVVVKQECLFGRRGYNTYICVCVSLSTYYVHYIQDVPCMCHIKWPRVLCYKLHVHLRSQSTAYRVALAAL